LPELLDQLANLERLASPANKEFLVPPESLVGLHPLALNQASPPANLAQLDPPDLPDMLESQVMLDLLDPPVKMVPQVKMVQPAPLDPPDLLELLVPTAPLVTKAKMERKSQSYQENPVKPELMELLDPKEAPDPTAPLELLANPVPKAPSDPLDPLVLMAQSAKMVPPAPTDLLERRAFAPSIVLWMVAFSSKTVPDSKLISYNEGLLLLDPFRSVPLCLLLLLCRSQTRVRRT